MMEYIVFFSSVLERIVRLSENALESKIRK